MVCPCCVQEEPCSVTINGTRVGLGQIDFANALDIACWGGSIYPGRLALIQNGTAQYDLVLSEWNWFVSTQQVHLPGDPGLDSNDGGFGQKPSAIMDQIKSSSTLAPTVAKPKQGFDIETKVVTGGADSTKLKQMLAGLKSKAD